MRWTVGLQLSLVADGGPFSIKAGQLPDWFALSFICDQLSLSESARKSAKETKLGVYSIHAEVICMDENAIVLDCGIPAVRDPKYISLPKDLKAGQYVTGSIGLIMPLCTAPFPDDLSELVEVHMRVNRMFADTTPDIIEVDGRGCVIRNPRFVQAELQRSGLRYSGGRSVPAHLRGVQRTRCLRKSKSSLLI